MRKGTWTRGGVALRWGSRAERLGWGEDGSKGVSRKEGWKIPWRERQGERTMVVKMVPHHCSRCGEDLIDIDQKIAGEGRTKGVLESRVFKT